MERVRARISRGRAYSLGALAASRPAITATVSASANAGTRDGLPAGSRRSQERRHRLVGQREILARTPMEPTPGTGLMRQSRISVVRRGKHLFWHALSPRYHPTKPWKRMPYGTDGSRAAC